MLCCPALCGALSWGGGVGRGRVAVTCVLTRFLLVKLEEEDDKRGVCRMVVEARNSRRRVGGVYCIAQCGGENINDDIAEWCGRRAMGEGEKGTRNGRTHS